MSSEEKTRNVFGARQVMHSLAQSLVTVLPIAYCCSQCGLEFLFLFVSLPSKAFI